VQTLMETVRPLLMLYHHYYSYKDSLFAEDITDDLYVADAGEDNTETTSLPKEYLRCKW
jgi:hypothetical protein